MPDSSIKLTLSKHMSLWICQWGRSKFASLSLCESVSKSGCLSARPSARQSVVSKLDNQSVNLSVCPSVSRPVCQPARLSACLSVSLSVCLSVSLAVYLSVWLTVSQSVCLSDCMTDCHSVDLSVGIHVNNRTLIFKQNLRFHLLWRLAFPDNSDEEGWSHPCRGSPLWHHLAPKL